MTRQFPIFCPGYQLFRGMARIRISMLAILLSFAFFHVPHFSTLKATAATIRVSPAPSAGTSDTTKAPMSLQKTNEDAKPGDTIVLFDGIYRTPIAPTHSGTPSKPIIYQAQHPGGVTITGVENAIQLSGRGYVLIKNIHVQDVTLLSH